MSKAYDRIGWDFLKHALTSVGVIYNAQELIMSCVQTASFAILLNGHPKGIIKKMEESGLYSGYQINRWAPNVSHIMFVDDKMLFGNTNTSTINSISTILQQYYISSGQPVNYSKSSIHFSNSVSESYAEEIVQSLGVTRIQKEGKYLSIRILQQGNIPSYFNYLIEKFEEKLSGWKINNLSHAGITTLIQSVLSLIPVYYMATQNISKTILNKLSKIIRNFWWGHNKDTRKMHFLKWEWFNLPKEKEGMGIRSLSDLNHALTEKLAWRFLHEDDSLWAEILRAKYMRNISFWDVKKQPKCSTTLSAMLDSRNVLKKGCLWLVGNGQNIHIYSDPWIPSLNGASPTISEAGNTSITKVNQLMSEVPGQWNMEIILQQMDEFTANHIGQTLVNSIYAQKLTIYIATRITLATLLGSKRVCNLSGGINVTSANGGGDVVLLSGLHQYRHGCPPIDVLVQPMMLLVDAGNIVELQVVYAGGDASQLTHG
ncbi:uncharacterized protein LOC113317766 [Papaver somniferum]|uniref:uncharacterized protein LOC113317766 n=1 Tax=Papaver somniferum TaxID=3469 RepID=UPI000E6FDA40|nr:uncharacterized protein LOC113317766 [Papaver somniferum]